MGCILTADELFIGLKKLTSEERNKFFILIANNAFRDDNYSHEEIFGHLKNEKFTAHESAEYLEVSIATFRRLVQSGKLKPTEEMGRNQLFSTQNLKAFKKIYKAYG